MVVTLAGWETALACDSRGKLKSGTGGLACATCHVMRRGPALRNTIPDPVEVDVLDSHREQPAAGIHFDIPLAAH